MKNSKIFLNIDSQFYSTDIIYSTVDALSGEYVFLCKKANNKFKIAVKPRFGQEIIKETVENIFYDELNNQIIRERIFSKTQNLRELIVGKALLGTESFYDDHSYFDINSYPANENYISDENKIAEINVQNEKQ